MNNAVWALGLAIAAAAHLSIGLPALLSVLNNPKTTLWCGWLVLGAASAGAATPAITGQSGYVNMPSARVEADGTFSLGYSYDNPYGTLWVSSTILPALQVTGRFVSVAGVPGFTNVPGEYGSGYGRFKDKVIDAKFQLRDESAWLPAVAVGATDLMGTERFKGQYLVATKSFGAARQLEASVGVGRLRPDGVFGGVRWTPQSAPRWSLVAEYDANDYQTDYRAAATAAGTRSKGPVVAAEYRWGWLGAQVARHRDHFSAGVFASVPLSEREFVPKIMEPAPFKPKNPPLRVSVAQWHADPAQGAALVNALARQDFKNIRVAMDGSTLKLVLTNSRISDMGRAVGRASRTALAFAPLGTRALQITYTKVEQPVATYEFVDMATLDNYLTGQIGRQRLLDSVVVRYAQPSDRADADNAGLVAGVDESGAVRVLTGRDGDAVQLSSEDREDNRFKIAPKMGFFFNDPSGALRYELAAAANYDRRLGQGLYLNSALRLKVLENISGVTQASNSLLPHVRTDIAEYKRGGRFKLNRLLLNQYLNPAERVYVRLSGGIYEEMYSGAGAQVLYLPKDERWATDLTVDALAQRGYKGWFDTRDYRTVTALAALHYKLPYNVTATVRAGRFLARDTGARLEFKRRFRSGVEVGAWYSKTNGNDISSPGTPSSPYHDKGIFMSIPLSSMLPMDSQATAGLSLSPWTRDVGQMVTSPGDLYELMEQPRRDLNAYDGLGDFSERADERTLPAVARPDVAPAPAWPAFRRRLDQSKAEAPPLSDWLIGGGLAGGAILLSSALDRPVDKYVRRHDDSRLARGWNNFGNNMPIALVATSGIAALFGDERVSNSGVISLQSVALSLGVAGVGKYLTARARPDEERGPFARVGAGESRRNSSFPSAHSAVAFAAVTPFAQEYNAPWLYGVAAVSSMGRIAGRKHWVSDTVAGGIVGYAVGTLLWKGQRDYPASQLTVMPGPKEISVAWNQTY